MTTKTPKQKAQETLIRQVLTLLREAYPNSMAAGKIAAAIGRSKRTLLVMLNVLKNQGEVFRVGGGHTAGRKRQSRPDQFWQATEWRQEAFERSIAEHEALPRAIKKGLEILAADEAAEADNSPIQVVTVRPSPQQLKPTAIHLHDCYGNSARVALANRNCSYVEGFVDLGDGGEPVAHAWNECNGIHFDVTGILIDEIAAKHKAPSRFTDCPHYPVLRVTHSALKKACKNQAYSHDHLRGHRNKAQALSNAVLVKITANKV